MDARNYSFKNVLFVRCERAILVYLSRMKDRLAKSSADRLNWNMIEGSAITIFCGDPTLQSFRDRHFHFFGKSLIAAGLTANRLSLIGLAFALVAAIFVHNPAIFSLALIVNMICDGMDGVVARIEGTEGDAGSVIDILCDTISIIIVAIGLAFHGSVSWSLLVLFVFVITAYTLRSMLKSKLLHGIYRSVGSRIFTFLGLSLISALNLVGMTIIDPNELLVGILAVLSLSLVLDVLRSRNWFFFDSL